MYRDFATLTKGFRKERKGNHAACPSPLQIRDGSL
jgi:hypothetical protein